MKLDYDCLRAVLLFLEDHQQYQDAEADELFVCPVLLPVPVETISRALAGEFSPCSVHYVCRKACEAGLLTSLDVGDDSVYIADITFNGHEYIRVMRNDTVWRKVRQAAAKVGGLTLECMFSLGVSYLKALATPASAPTGKG